MASSRTIQDRKKYDAKKSRDSLQAADDASVDAALDASYAYGYDDPRFISAARHKKRWTASRYIALVFALLLVVGVWFALDYKLIVGKSWISATYDNPDWRTNEGNLHTFGAWDIETHIWKTEYILENFPNFQWNPYWYLGSPLLKFYQPGFYVVHIAVILLSGLDAARAALLMVVSGHLLAALVTFLLCYKLSRKIWVSAFASIFILANTFISLRSYGWEPITVVFLFLYPLGLLFFLKRPLEPFRFSVIIILAAAYLSHPLIWLSLCMTIFIYLLSIALRKDIDKRIMGKHYILEFMLVVALSLMISAVQFIPQLSYDQVTSGAHMGVTYLPYYQVPFNVISVVDFFLDAGNLKGPGPVVLIALLLLLLFIVAQYVERKQSENKNKARGLSYRNGRNNKYANEHNMLYGKRLSHNPVVTGIAVVIVVIILFYYMELYNIFPMNMLRSVQYHRIIPEIVILCSALVAVLSNYAYTSSKKTLYYSIIIAFALTSGIVIYNVQSYWNTTDTISDTPEFITDDFPGRISFPYTDQSLAVRSSFTKIPQVYGYYEQGITNSYADELFSVSSGFHNNEQTILYLKAANVKRLYVNMHEGERDFIVRSRLGEALEFHYDSNISLPDVDQRAILNDMMSQDAALQYIPANLEGPRYAYFDIPLEDADMVQAVSRRAADAVNDPGLGCRELFRDNYCSSIREEFVGTDPMELKYLSDYVGLTERPYGASADIIMHDPEHYSISVTNATTDTAVIVKMTYDTDFRAYVDGDEVAIGTIGPDFMIISPMHRGSYTIDLEYTTSIYIIIGILISIISLLGTVIYFSISAFTRKRRSYSILSLSWRKGDLK